jgi:hypothetical protein
MSQITANPRGRNHSNGNLIGISDEVDGSAFADLIDSEDGRHRFR